MLNNKLLKLFLLIISSLHFAQQKKISLSAFPDNKVMVVAHRGDWREAPENSVWAVKKAIEKGVDMAEIDLAMTKDSVLILMHDNTIDRTTTGKGKPSDFTLAEIKKLHLRDGLGVETQMSVPTLQEILEISDGKILLNLDKGFEYIKQVYPLVKKRNMLDQILFKGHESYSEFNQKYGDIKNEIHYMPIIQLGKEEDLKKISEYLKSYKVYGFEFTIGTTEKNLIDFKKLRETKVKIWVNSLWPHHNAGNNDDLVLDHPNIYDWYIDKGVNIIQTDRPKELIHYLKSKKLYF
ncbi:glycerophosphodiester phosphodiesterase family protein [Chryseobacterium culicis]|uniref:Glycerophosphodiester phosphodiesterase n=1 Tax=Chryseobacterium culicis TaxID=680127 RepID=A0A2S9CXJ7_CHRCI|nr:glycerophosphodiester phosphodiesterase family protein [Chryseobacterium culicis]PRB85180.1 glycerophosphodiester phosphodiesterase [Chryseobacterium culicis]PRB91097.1 glycerophosphodiester phosphodiesterase [Chryseobacterium culicis]